MSQKPISPLRQRMLEDMSLRGFTPDTQRDYVRAVKKLAAFLGRSPDAATAEDLRAFQLHLTASGVQPTNHQHDGDGVAVLLQGNARPAGGQGCSAAQRCADTRRGRRFCAARRGRPLHPRAQRRPGRQTVGQH